MLHTLESSAKSLDCSMLSKRGKTLLVPIQVRPVGNQPLHLVVESSGVKLYGEGERKARQHGISKRRTWKKAHLG